MDSDGNDLDPPGTLFESAVTRSPTDWLAGQSRAAAFRRQQQQEPEQGLIKSCDGMLAAVQATVTICVMRMWRAFPGAGPRRRCIIA